MTDRRYTIAEIDQMRADLQMAASYRRGYLEAAVLEDRLRTALAAGLDPTDVKADVVKAHQEASDRYQRAVATNGMVQALGDLLNAQDASGIIWPDQAYQDYEQSGIILRGYRMPSYSTATNVSRVTCN